MSRLFDSQRQHRAELKRQRQEHAQRQADAIRSHLTEYESEKAAKRRFNLLQRRNRIFTLGLFLVFILLLLLALALGGSLYRNLVMDHSEQKVIRQQISLIAADVHSLDKENAVVLGQGPEGQALVLETDVEGKKFEVRYYLYEDKVMREELLASKSIDPSSATAVFESSVFDLQLDENLLTITTDAGVSHVSLHSVQGGDE